MDLTLQVVPRVAFALILLHTYTFKFRDIYQVSTLNLLDGAKTYASMLLESGHRSILAW